MTKAPNLLFIMSDDHAAHAISTYGSEINSTPMLDRIAETGVRLDNAFCTNSICAPSRAAILTGTYNHINAVTTLDTPLDNSLWTFPAELGARGWQTALIGKWHLGHGPTADPTMFDYWRVLPGQGHYHDPVMLDPGGVIVERGGYVTDLITEDCIEWIDNREPGQPFALFCHHKAPHRRWDPAPRHFAMYDDVDIAEPPTFRDDLVGRADVVQAVKMRMMDLDPVLDLAATVPDGLSLDEEISWRYQRYIKRYLACVAAIDESVGRLLEHLEASGLADDTIVVYTSDQGFFLGEHGWFDKRLMYEESLRMPMLVRWPNSLPAGINLGEIVTNVDLAPTLLDLCGIEPPEHLQGRSFAPLLRGDAVEDWPKSMYYRYWMHNDGSHQCPAHYGIRTGTHKLIVYYNDPLGEAGANGPLAPVECELYDLVADPYETVNLWDEPSASDVRRELAAELERLQHQVGDTPYPGVLQPPS